MTVRVIFVSLILAIFSVNADVVTLTGETFSDKVKEKDTAWFIQFCVPWCKHCTNFSPIWDDVGNVMEAEDHIEIGSVDCTTSRALCRKVDIHSYPTIKIFYGGKEVSKYKGPKKFDLLRTFILEEGMKVTAEDQGVLQE